jgi:hypothetical protein
VDRKCTHLDDLSLKLPLNMCAVQSLGHQAVQALVGESICAMAEGTLVQAVNKLHIKNRDVRRRQSAYSGVQHLSCLCPMEERSNDGLQGAAH